MTEEEGKEASDESLLRASREGLDAAISREGTQRADMLDDLRFCALQQWDASIRNDRENDPNGARPCLTIDKINQYVTQVVNDMRQNRPSVKVRPVDDAADVDTAKIFQGLVRHIEEKSNAQVAYTTAGESATKIGLGYFRIVTDYIAPDSFDQEPLVRRIPNTFSVYLGQHIMPDGSDAEEAWIIEPVPLEDFKRLYPEASTADSDFAGLTAQPTWKTDKSVSVCEYFYRKKTTDTLYYLEDGRVLANEQYESLPKPSPAITGERQRTRTEVKWCKHTGAEVLEKKDWAGKYIPIVEVIGKETFLDGARILWGLVRPAKDSLRMYNYWASAVTEKIALSPKTPYIGAVGQFEGLEDRWASANRENRAYLEYKPVDINGNAVPRPAREGASPLETAMIEQMRLIEHDVQTSLGMFKAAVGEAMPQQSGRAILALTRESDAGTFHFADNLALSIQHCGRILVDLIPKIMDTERIARIIGEDGESQTVRLNPEQEGAHREVLLSEGKIERIYNLGVGNYDVTVTVGPSYATKRMESSAAMLEMVKSNPEMLRMIGHIMFRNFDWPDADKIADIFRKLLPPQLQEPADAQAPIPPQAAAQIAQLTQVIQGLQGQGQAMAQENQTLKSGALEVQAKIAAKERETEAELALKRKAQDEEFALAQERMEREFALKRETMLREQALESDKIAFEQQCATVKVNREGEAMARSEAADDAAMMPQMMTTLQHILAEIAKPRVVSVEGITKNEQGRITGATIQSQTH